MRNRKIGNRAELAALGLFILLSACGRAPEATPAKALPPQFSSSMRLASPNPQSPVHDQGYVGFCWSYTLSSYMESIALQHGQQVELSPEYLGFYHLYAQVKAKLPTLLWASKFHLPKVAQTVIKGMAMVFDPIGVASEGSYGYSPALNELKQFGTVPDSIFHLKFSQKNANVQAKLNDVFIDWIASPAKIERAQKDPDFLMSELAKVYGKQPPKPTDTFEYGGKTYTPMSFMQNYVGFNPDDYQEVTVKGANHDVELRMLGMLFQRGWSVPITIVVHDDYKTAKDTGVFDLKNCATQDCKILGGHAVLAVNELVSNHGDVNAVLIKNSWGPIGLDSLGQVTPNPSERGYFLITNDYLKSSFNTGSKGFWSYVAPKSELSWMHPAASIN